VNTAEIALKLIAVPAALNVVAQLRPKSQVGLLKGFVQSTCFRKHTNVRTGTSNPNIALDITTMVAISTLVFAVSLKVGEPTVLLLKHYSEADANLVIHHAEHWWHLSVLVLDR